MIKKGIALLILAALLISALTGCGAAAETSSVAANKTSSAAASTASTASETSSAPKEMQTIKIFGSFWPEEQNEVTLYFLEQAELANSVKLELEVPPQASYAEKLQIMLVGGNYPDVVNFSSHTDKLFIQGVNDGLFVPITEQIKNAPNLLAHTYDITWEAVKTKQTEDIYMIPRTTVVRSDGLCLRQDWLDKLGIKLPADAIISKEEFFDIMKQFTENDPDGNNKKDTYGILPSPPADGYLYPISVASFGDLGWQASTGKYKYMSPALEIGNASYKAALEFTSSLWTAGYIHPDWPILKAGDDGTKLFAGEVGSITAFAGHIANREIETQKINPDAKMTYLAGIKNSEGKLIGSSISAGIWGGWAITNVCKDPQRVVDTYDWMLSDEGWRIINYGKLDVTYTLNGDTPAVIPDKYKELKFNSWGSIFMRRSDDPTFFLDLSLPQAQLDQTKAWIQTAMDAVVFAKDMGFKPEITNDAAYTEADNKRKEVVSKIIMGALPIEEYDKILEAWYAKGGETFVQQMNEYISSKEK